MKESEFQILQEDTGQRLDVFLTKAQSASRSAVQKWIKEGNVLVMGVCQKASYKLEAGDRLLVRVPDPLPLQASSEDIPLIVVYEDEHVIVINKPQGMVVHPAPGHSGGTVVNGLLHHCKEGLSGINGVQRPGIVHRIDKDTSGLLMVAKTDLAHQSLVKQLSEHTITRKYHAICVPSWKEDAGTIEAPIGRNKRDRKKMAVVQGGKAAITHFIVLEQFAQAAYMEVTLETGRTHQIRVHMAYRGHPLLGDRVYGPERQLFGLTKQTLHAKTLGFVHPATGEYMEFTSELPGYFQTILDKLG